MKKFLWQSFFTFPILLFSFTLHSQDLIKTTSKKEINCKILKRTDDSVFYSYSYDNQILKASLPCDSILEYYFKYYIDSLPTQKVVVKSYYRSRIAIDLGMGYRFAETSSDNPTDNQKEMANGLQWGLNASASCELYLNKYIGLGVKSSFFQTWDKPNINFLSYNGISTFEEKILHKSSTVYIGPAFICRFLPSYNKDILWASLSFGLINYSEKAEGMGSHLFYITGNTVGVSLELGRDIRVSKKIGLGISAYSLFGRLNSYEFKGQSGYKNVEKWEFPENLTRLGVTLGLRFYN